MEKLKIIALIPARGGSKTIPHKNIKKLAGKPLIVHTIEVSKSSSLIDRIIVSTDSQQIADISKKAGAEVPFLRPAEFAQDDTLDLPVFIHCLEWMKVYEQYIPDILVHLRPTSPLRTVEMLDTAIQMLVDNPLADSVRTVCEPSQSPFKMWTKAEDGYLKPLCKSDIGEVWNQPRQVLPTVYWQNGYVDVTRTKIILGKKSMTGDKILPLIVDNRNIIDIDDEISFQLAETLYLKNREI